jgi:glycosyltransferase involved in cell wall biosynthesis
VRFIENRFEGYRDQKNFALSQASHDYVLSLDADEELSPELEKSILLAKQNLIYDGYKFNRLNNFCGRWIRHTSMSPERKIRLFNRKKARWVGLNIHETVVTDNPKSVKTLKGNLIHWLYATHEESISKMNNYTSILACEYYNQGIKASAKRILINPLWRFFHSFILKGGFLDGYDGYVVSRFLAYTCFLKYAKLRNIYIGDRQLRKKGYFPANDALLRTSDKEGVDNPILVGFDAKRAFYNHSGLGNYSRNLLNSLNKNYPGNSYYLFTPETKNRVSIENEDSYRLIKPQSFILKQLSSLWRVCYIRNDISNNKLQIYHGLSQELPVGIEKTGVKSVVTVHDLIFLRFPEFYNTIDAKIYYWKLAHACRVADHIVAISNQTKNDLVRFLLIPPNKITVIHQGCNQIFWKSFTKESFQAVRIKYNLPDRYLLYLGTIEERKNLLGIVKAMHIRNISIPLVVIGRKVDGYFQKVLNYISVNKISNVIFTERISSQDLPGIYQNAECFIYPSFFEGFGIPLLEALVSKTPVITSRKGCFAEAAGPGSIYVDPYDPEEIGDAINKVISNEEIRNRMIAAGTAFAENFKDEVIAEKYNKLYRSLLNKSENNNIL